MMVHRPISVTQRDIDRGLQGDSFSSPVALAVRRALKADAVWACEVIIVTKAGSHQTFVTPPEVEDFLERYDSAILEFESPRPFSFIHDPEHCRVGPNPQLLGCHHDRGEPGAAAKLPQAVAYVLG